MQNATNNNSLIAAATITAELGEVRSIAKSMSLGVMNAKAISLRAGESARGFKPVTDFIDEMARDVMKLIVHISREAHQLSQTSVKRNHLQNSMRRFYEVVRQDNTPKYIESLNPILAKIEKEQQYHDRQFMLIASKLENLLEDILLCTRGAHVVATSSRVEASHTQEFRVSLEVVADDTQHATEQIRSHVTHSQRLLKDVIQQITHR